MVGGIKGRWGEIKGWWKILREGGRKVKERCDT